MCAKNRECKGLGATRRNVGKVETRFMNRATGEWNEGLKVAGIDICVTVSNGRQIWFEDPGILKTI